MIYGIGTFVGNMVGGRAADRSLDRSLLVFVVGLAVVLALFGFLGQHPLGLAARPRALGCIRLRHCPGSPTATDEPRPGRSHHRLVDEHRRTEYRQCHWDMAVRHSDGFRRRSLVPRRWRHCFPHGVKRNPPQPNNDGRERGSSSLSRNIIGQKGKASCCIVCRVWRGPWREAGRGR
jgi:hypothetical protein